MIEKLLVTVANAHKDTPVVVDVGGNGKSLLPVTAAEVKDGKLVIVCKGRAADSSTVAPSKAQEQVSGLAAVLMKEFGGPTKNESACEMAVRVLREQQAQIEALTAPPSSIPSAGDPAEPKADADIPGIENIELR